MQPESEKVFLWKRWVTQDLRSGQEWTSPNKMKWKAHKGDGSMPGTEQWEHRLWRGKEDECVWGNRSGRKPEWLSAGRDKKVVQVRQDRYLQTAEAMHIMLAMLMIQKKKQQLTLPLFICLATPGLSCGMLDVWSSFVACGIFSYGMWTLSCSMWAPVAWPGIKPRPPQLGTQSLSHWTTREVPRMLVFILCSVDSHWNDFICAFWRCLWLKSGESVEQG